MTWEIRIRQVLNKYVDNETEKGKNLLYTVDIIDLFFIELYVSEDKFYHILNLKQ